MADRTSAAVFGEIFELLAKDPTDDHKELASKIYQMSGQYDFSPYQMGADEAGKALGLARMGVRAGYPDDGEKLLWPDERENDEPV